MNKDLKFQVGFGNQFASEAIKGALPEGRNSPQKASYGLYAEQLNGSAFTKPRGQNLRTWMYRIRPSVVQSPFQPYKNSVEIETAPAESSSPTPNQLRWDPLPYPSEPTDFIDGWNTLLTNGNANDQKGCAVHLYACNKSMDKRFFYNADGELLIVPQEGALHIRTEMGELFVEPTHVGVIPRGVKFTVGLEGAQARGYVCENYGRPFELPNLGPIGANGLANPRDFKTPEAKFEQENGSYELLAKYSGKVWASRLDYSPLNVVAWHGNYAPYQYDLNLFNTIGTVSYDHPDPSIFTVLTSPSEEEGVANIDFVIFPPRWMVAEKTFRPPYYHRNIMSEYMGLIKGQYDAKAEGFVPGGGSLHNCMSPHGPDTATFAAASEATLEPMKFDATLAFMFESRYAFEPTRFGISTEMLQEDYFACWQGLKEQFEWK